MVSPRRVRGRPMDADIYSHAFDSDQECDSEALLHEAIDSPAWSFIRDFLLSAQALDFDPRDPEIIRRAIRAGVAAHAAQPPPRPSLVGPVNAHDPVVYYMQLGNLVKIGTTTNIIGRASTLNPERILAVEPGNQTKEAERHREFAASRRHGEWFDLTPELELHITTVRTQFEIASGLTLDVWLARPSQRRKPLTLSASTPDCSPSGLEPGTLSRSEGSA